MSEVKVPHCCDYHNVYGSHCMMTYQMMRPEKTLLAVKDLITYHRTKAENLFGAPLPDGAIVDIRQLKNGRLVVTEFPLNAIAEKLPKIEVGIVKDPKEMSVKEFVELGYLQEVNRRLLHLLGLSLGFFNIDGTYSNAVFIMDNRNDSGGVIFPDNEIDEQFAKRAEFVQNELDTRLVSRAEKFGCREQHSEKWKE